MGYIASECPKKTVATFAEYQANFDSMEEPEEGADKELFLIEELEEYEEGPNEGETLVVRKALSGLTAPEN